MKLITTLALIRKQEPCRDGWHKILKHLGKSFPKNSHIGMDVLLESNGLDEALWGLRAVVPAQKKDRDRLARLFACECAGRVLHIFERECPDDKRPGEAIRVSQAFAWGKATGAEMAAAWNAAWDAVLDAAGTAAGAAAAASARDAAGTVARTAAEAAQKDIFRRYFCRDDLSQCILGVIVEELGGYEVSYPAMNGVCAAIHARVMSSINGYEDKGGL